MLCAILAAGVLGGAVTATPAVAAAPAFAPGVHRDAGELEIQDVARPREVLEVVQKLVR